MDSTAQDTTDSFVGRSIHDRYTVLSILGEGGMGRVYLAEQKMGKTNRKVAIKTLHADLSRDPQILARFHRETETVIGLEHPNTIKFYEFGEFEGQLFIVMEYIQGESLASVLQRGPIDPQRAEKILIQICGSLHEAHQLGVVHRDLKPENIILTNRAGQTDFVKVLDFGIAKRDDSEDAQQAKLTKQGMVLGTPPYMSPEQFTGQTLDMRSDIYSLGVMVYEMLSGQLPFDAKTPWEWASKHMTQMPRPLDSFPATARLQPKMIQAVMRALAKQRDQRPQNVMEFLRDFTGIDDPAASWTMATSGGAHVERSGQVPIPRSAVGTPGPMPQTAMSPMPFAGGTPPPGGQFAPTGAQFAPTGQQFAGGAPSFGGSSPAPFAGATPPPFAGATPAPMAYPGATPAPGYGTGYTPQAAPASGGGAGKIIAIVLVMLVLGAGGVGGIAYFAMQDDDTTTTQPTAVAVTTQVPPPTVAYPPTMPAYPPTSPTGTTLSPTLSPTGSPMGTTLSPTGTTLSPTGNPTGTAVLSPTMPTPVPTPPVIPSTPQIPNTPGNDTRPSGPSADDEARARSYVSSGLAATNGGDIEGGVSAMRNAQRLVGRSHSTVRPLRDALTSRGANRVGSLLQRGSCPQAQALYRQLASVGCAGNARAHFGDWCPAP